MGHGLESSPDDTDCGHFDSSASWDFLHLAIDCFASDPSAELIESSLHDTIRQENN
jgi:hypothetical protein